MISRTSSVQYDSRITWLLTLTKHYYCLRTRMIKQVWAIQHHSARYIKIRWSVRCISSLTYIPEMSPLLTYDSSWYLDKNLKNTLWSMYYGIQLFFFFFARTSANNHGHSTKHIMSTWILGLIQGQHHSQVTPSFHNIKTVKIPRLLIGGRTPWRLPGYTQSLNTHRVKFFS